MRFLIIGGGVAGTTAAQELRARDPHADITLVSEESHALYSRVLLPHYLKGKVPRERVFLKKETWYQEAGIEWLRGLTATALDPRNGFVTLSDGRELPYDKLLIATGGEVRLVDSDPRGVSYLRTLDDADHLLQLVTEGGITRAAIYGGGFIACEYVNYFAHLGIPTTVVHRGAHFFTRSLTPEAGALIAKRLIEHGVVVRPQQELVALKGERELAGLVTTKGECACDLLGVGIGIEPDFDWLRQAGLEVGVGIKADAFLETNLPNVYTAGDVAEFFDPAVGRQHVVGNWMNAMSQGRHVAAVMTGERKPFGLVSSYATNILGLELIFVGDTDRTAADEIKILGSIEEGGITQIFERDGRVVGGVMVGRNGDRAAVTRAIQERVAWRQHKAVDTR